MSRRLRAEAKSNPLPVRLSPEERRTIVQAARLNYQTVSQFAREAMVSAAADCMESTGPTGSSLLFITTKRNT